MSHHVACSPFKNPYAKRSSTGNRNIGEQVDREPNSIANDVFRGLQFFSNLAPSRGEQGSDGAEFMYWDQSRATM